MSNDTTHYETLGVDRGATAAEVRAAYRRLALQVHPDKAGPGSEAQFQSVCAAHQVLTDPAARLRYDAALFSSGIRLRTRCPAAPPADTAQRSARPYGARRPASASARVYRTATDALEQLQRARAQHMAAAGPADTATHAAAPKAPEHPPEAAPPEAAPPEVASPPGWARDAELRHRTVRQQAMWATRRPRAPTPSAAAPVPGGAPRSPMAAAGPLGRRETATPRSFTEVTVVPSDADVQLLCRSEAAVLARVLRHKLALAEAAAEVQGGMPPSAT